METDSVEHDTSVSYFISIVMKPTEHFLAVWMSGSLESGSSVF